MLTQYSNINDILIATGSVSAYRLPNKTIAQLKYIKPEVSVNSNIGTVVGTTELHVYSNDVWITGNHDIHYIQSIRSYLE